MFALHMCQQYQIRATVLLSLFLSVIISIGTGVLYAVDRYHICSKSFTPNLGDRNSNLHATRRRTVLCTTARIAFAFKNLLATTA
jgi:hypothetical protein